VHCTKRVLEILANRKEKSELTMCTDVDRNDKSRVCIPGSVQVVGRRFVVVVSSSVFVTLWGKKMSNIRAMQKNVSHTDKLNPIPS